MRSLRGLCALSIALLGLNSTANAALAINFLSRSATADINGEYTYFYQMTVSNIAIANVGDFVTLFDVNGYVPGSLTPTTVTSGSDLTGFESSVQNEGITPDDPGDYTTIVNDDPNVANITFVKIGTSVEGPAGPYLFSLRSTIGLVGDRDTYAGQFYDTIEDTPGQNNGTTRGPASVPEPSVTALLGVVSLMGLGYSKVRSSRKPV